MIVEGATLTQSLVLANREIRHFVKRVGNICLGEEVREDVAVRFAPLAVPLGELPQHVEQERTFLCATEAVGLRQVEGKRRRR